MQGRQRACWSCRRWFVGTVCLSHTLPSATRTTPQPTIYAHQEPGGKNGGLSRFWRWLWMEWFQTSTTHLWIAYKPITLANRLRIATEEDKTLYQNGTWPGYHEKGRCLRCASWWGIYNNTHFTDSKETKKTGQLRLTILAHFLRSP